MSYCILWRFAVAQARRAEFEAAYGPDGPWAELFGKAEGFIGVELLRSAEEEGSYLTIDRWTTREAFEAFRRNFASEYAALDRRLGGLAATETRIGAFAEISGPVHREIASG